jgi:hypothetical protein
MNIFLGLFKNWNGIKKYKFMLKKNKLRNNFVSHRIKYKGPFSFWSTCRRNHYWAKSYQFSTVSISWDLKKSTSNAYRIPHILVSIFSKSKNIYIKYISLFIEPCFHFQSPKIHIRLLLYLKKQSSVKMSKNYGL